MKGEFVLVLEGKKQEENPKNTPLNLRLKPPAS